MHCVALIVFPIPALRLPFIFSVCQHLMVSPTTGQLQTIFWYLSVKSLCSKSSLEIYLWWVSVLQKKKKTTCHVFLPQHHNASFDWGFLSKKECLKYGGQLVGNNCNFVPDVTLMSFILFLGTYTCSMALKKFKTSRYFPTTVSTRTLNKFHCISHCINVNMILHNEKRACI